MSTWLYIDGLSLYYGSVKGTPHKWLDLQTFAGGFDLEPPITRVHYFVTRDPDPARQTRQDLYLRALRTLPQVRVHDLQGSHAVAELSQRILEDDRGGRFSRAAILSNDGRLLAALLRLNRPWCALLPNKRGQTNPAFVSAASFSKRISSSILATSQLPTTVHDASGPITRPASWV